MARGMATVVTPTEGAELGWFSVAAPEIALCAKGLSALPAVRTMRP
jgi:hypothetical protein